MQSYEGVTIDHYQVMEPLGRGGMAVVYRAYDTRLRRDVAIKLIRSEAIPAEQHPHLIQRFEREAHSMARLTHPNIVGVHDFGSFQGAPYLVMDYLPGGTLKDYTGKPMDYRAAAALLAPIADALAYAHAKGVIHRDVKPSNILVTPSGTVMLTDFGIAKLLEESETNLTGTGFGVGTPQYMAPEQWKNQVCPQTDIYALGTIFYELVTGVRPYDADTPAAIAIMQATEPLKRPRHYIPALPEAVEQVLFTALAFQPASRYASMAEYRTALSQVHQGIVQPPIMAAVSPAISEALTIDALSESAPLAAHLPSFNKDTAPAADAEKPHKTVSWPVIAGAGFFVLALAVVGVIWALSLLNPSPKAAAQSSPTDNAAEMETIGEAMAAAEEEEENPETAASEVEQATLPTRQPTQMPSPTASTVLEIGSSLVREADGMLMMYVPAGGFLMGSSGDAQASESEFPQHQEVLSAYWMDEHEVTNQMFQLFVDATGYVTEAEKIGSSYVRSGEDWVEQIGANWRHPTGPGSSPQANAPVIHVNLFDAQAYCEWAGARLPTEEEWEKAARGTEGNIYPWGNQLPTGAYLNMSDQSIALSWSEPFNDGYSETSPVKQYPAGVSPYGLYDMAGNVWEWTNSCYSEDYNSTRVCNYYVLKGGSFSASLRHVRAAGRKTFLPDHMHGNLGFRCVMDAH